MNCYYGPSYSNYQFRIIALNPVADGGSEIEIMLDNLPIIDSVYKIEGYTAYQQGAKYSTDQVTYATNDTTGGEITFTKIDTTNQIISGTFYFDVVNSNGYTLKITKGRFDLIYK